MRLIKVKKAKKIVWHEICGGLYDYKTKEKEPIFIVELTQDEYMSLAQNKAKGEKK